MNLEKFAVQFGTFWGPFGDASRHRDGLKENGEFLPINVPQILTEIRREKVRFR